MKPNVSSRLGLVSVLAALMCVPGGQGLARTAHAAKSAARAPTLKHGDDFGGVWLEKDTLLATVQDWRNKPTPPYKGEWKKVYDTQQARSARGEQIERLSRLCWPPGMPTFNNFIYPVEILMNPGQVTFAAEYFQQTRRVYTDGRGHPAPDDLDLNFQGHSIGHWEGKTLVVDTIGFREDSYMRRPGFHSDQMHITERIRKVGPNQLEWTTITEDPIALEKPWVVTRTMLREPKGSEIREFVCAEEEEAREAFKPPLDPTLPIELRVPKESWTRP